MSRSGGGADAPLSQGYVHPQSTSSLTDQLIEFLLVSYDIAKDGEKVAVLTFIKPAYRLGESVVGAIEFNDPKLRSNVVKVRRVLPHGSSTHRVTRPQFSAMLEAHEALPAILRSGGRSSRRVHAEYHASFVGHLSRGVFSLDIPPDSTPTFGIVLPVGPDDALSEGGLEWKVRLCFLVAVPRGDGDIRRMCKDGRAGEWGASWKATDGVAPLQCVAQSAIPPPVTSSWSSMLLGSSVPAWSDGEVEETMRLDTVECEVPIRVWPSATLFKPLECHFDA